MYLCTVKLHGNAMFSCGVDQEQGFGTIAALSANLPTLFMNWVFFYREEFLTCRNFFLLHNHLIIYIVLSSSHIYDICHPKWIVMLFFYSRIMGPDILQEVPSLEIPNILKILKTYFPKNITVSPL